MRNAKLLLRGYNLARFIDMINLPRAEFRLVVALYTGHCLLKKHLSNVGMASCANCRFCDMRPETLEYLILDCTCKCMLKASIHLCGIAPSKYLEYIKMLGLCVYTYVIEERAQ